MTNRVGPIPYPVMSISGTFLVAPISGHHPRGQAHSRLSEHIADPLSRLNQPITSEWSLHHEILTRVFGTERTQTGDMFATVHNAHLPQFMSPIPEPQPLAIDALSQECQPYQAAGFSEAVSRHASSRRL